MLAKRLQSWSFSAKLLLLLWLATLPLVNPWVRGDGVGYYAYVHALLIRHDLNFQNEWQHANPSFRLSRVNPEGRVLPSQFTRTGHVGNHFAVGASMLWAPFLIVVHGAVLGFDHLGGSVAADGYSRPYLLAMALATAFYGFLALWLSFVLAREYFGDSASRIATLGIWFGSSLPVYMYFNPSWAHAQAAFTTALFLWYWHRTRASRTFRQWILLGFAGGLMLDVYYPNAVFLLLPLADALGAYRRMLPELGLKARELGRHFCSHLAFAVAVAVSYLPTLATREILYGNPFTFAAYGAQRWSWWDPAFASVLFSRDHGLLSWTPLLALALAGLFVFWRKDRRTAALLLLIFLAFDYLIACYQDWDGISSFGNRFFISLTPLFVIGLAALLDATRRWPGRRPWVWRGSCAVVGLLVVWNLGFIFQWGTQLVPERGPVSWRRVAANQFDVVPRVASKQLVRYFRNRSGMMRQIERRDVRGLNARPEGSPPAPPRTQEPPKATPD